MPRFDRAVQVGNSQYACFRSAGAASFRALGLRLTIRPAETWSFKLGPTTVEGHYKLHKSSAAASVPPHYELASAQGQ
jgi:hypothetical protein